MSEGRLTADQVRALAEGMGHPVAPGRLEALTEGVNRLMEQLAGLDALDLEGLERADALDFLRLRPGDVPEP
ncbi:MAG: hypothetical protein V3V62_09705 [bacterium]